MSVQVYQDIITSTVTSKHIIRAAKAKGFNHKDRTGLLKMYLQGMEMSSGENPSLHYDLFRIADEYSWIEDGRKIIFPNDDLLTSAWKSKFDLGRLDGDANFIRTPFPRFVLALPTHIKFDGEELPSPLITFRRYDFENKQVDIDRFLQHYSLKTPMGVNPNDDFFGEQILYIQYQSKLESNLYHCLQLPQSVIPYVLSSKNAEEYLQRLDGCENTLNVKSGFSTTPEQAETQFKLIKLVVSLMVFYCVSPDSITEGLARYKSKATPRYLDKPGSYDKFILGAEYSSTGRKNAMHLRRLTHERYYRSEEFANTERGTRWIVCGADNTTYTQENPFSKD